MAKTQVGFLIWDASIAGNSLTSYHTTSDPTLNLRIYLRSKVREGEGEISPIYQFPPEITSIAELGQAKAKSQEFNLDFPCEWQGASYLSHLLLFPTVCFSRKLY